MKFYGLINVKDSFSSLILLNTEVVVPSKKKEMPPFVLRYYILNAIKILI